MGMLRSLLLLAVAGSLASCSYSPAAAPPTDVKAPGPSGPRGGAAPKHIAYRDTDGWAIHGDYYASPGARKAIVLLHQRGGSAADWKPLAEDLQAAGIAALAIDQRGAGRSVGKYNNNDAPWDTTPDIVGGIAWLAKQGFLPKHIALAGASYGANNAAIYAASHPEVPAIALLSPGVDYHGLVIPPALARYPGAILVLTCRDDQVADGGPGLVKRFAARAAVKVYEGSAHGTEILVEHAESLGALTDLFKGKA